MNLNFPNNMEDIRYPYWSLPGALWMTCWKAQASAGESDVESLRMSDGSDESGRIAGRPRLVLVLRR